MPETSKDFTNILQTFYIPFDSNIQTHTIGSREKETEMTRAEVNGRALVIDLDRLEEVLVHISWYPGEADVAVSMFYYEEANRETAGVDNYGIWSNGGQY